MEVGVLFGQVLWVVGAYILGSIPFGLIIAKTFCGIDPTTDGSRSIGATNVSRLCGFKYGVLTLACDVGKGALPVWLGMLLYPEPFFISMTGMACVLGHVFSCFMDFKGGKAVATSIGVFIPLAFEALLGACALCMLIIWRTGYVSAGSLTLLGSLPLILIFVGAWQWVPLSLVLCVIVAVKHRENIQRLRNGTEKPWLKSKQKAQ